MPRRLPAIFETNQRLSSLFSYLILSVMLVCASITYVQLFQWVTRGSAEFQWDSLPFLVFLVVLESIFTRPIARELEGRERFIYHAAEWITFIIFVKIVYYTIHGLDRLFFDLPRWQADFSSFFEGDFFFSLLFIIYAWFMARFSADNIDELNADPSDIHWDIGQIQNNRLNVRGMLTGRILWTGTVMVALAAITHLSMTAVLGSEASQGPVINIMVYFFLALVLFSQIQYALLRGRWFWHETPMAPTLTRQWIRYSLLFFAVLAVISYLLPTNYSMGLLETLNIVLNWLVSVLFFLVQLIFFPILWLLSIAGCSRQPDSQLPGVATLPTIPPAQPAASASIPWLELLQSILFWGLFLAIVIYSLVQFARQNPQILAFVRRNRLFNWTVSLLHWLRAWFSRAQAQFGGWILETREKIFASRLTSLTPHVRLWQNFRQLSARQQIIFYYLRLVERGGEHGLTRQPSQTPHQYAQTLESNLPDVQEDITGFTDSFLEARYSQHDIQAQQSTRVQRLWRNITRSLNRILPSHPGHK